MKINHYHKASSLQDAYDLLQEHPNNSLMGGGAWMKLTNKSIDTLIDVSSLSLDQIEETKDSVTIGAMVTLRQLETNGVIQNIFQGILSQAAGSIMGINVRNIATIGGSIMGRYSFSDVITALLVMNVTLHFYQAEPMLLQDFLADKHRSSDILTHLTIPNQSTKAYFYNVKKTAMDFAVINVAIAATDNIQIVVGARPGIAIFAQKAMEYINKEANINDAIIQKTAAIAATEIHVSSNTRASADYRKDLIEVYVRRGLEEVLQ